MKATDVMADMLRIYRIQGYDITLISLRKRYDNGDISLIQMGKIVNSLTSIEMMTTKERKMLDFVRKNQYITINNNKDIK